MLKPALVALTVMGCDCDARICVPVENATAHFASIEACEAAVVPAIRRGAGSFPLLTAHCAALPEPPATALASFEPAESGADTTEAHTLARAALTGGATRVGEAGRHLVFRVGDGFVAARGRLARMYRGAADIAGAAATWVAATAGAR